MLKYNKMRTLAVALFLTATVLFLVFFLYMGFFENVAEVSTGASHSYTKITDYEKQRLDDPSAPAGEHTEYRWTLDAGGTSESCLCFYVVHQQVRVFYDGELIYSLMPSENNRIGRTVSSNWVSTHIHHEDDGKEVTVMLTPIFKSGADYKPEFFVGSHFAIVIDQLKLDLSQIFLATLCVLLGILIMAVQVYFIFGAKMQNLNVLYLGTFSVLLGVWRMTDMRSSPILFEGNPMVLGYIAIGSLFLCSIPLVLFLSTLFSQERAVPLKLLSSLFSLTCIVVLALQVLGVADLKESLVVSHVMLVAGVAAVLLMALLGGKKNRQRHVNKSWKYALILLAGIAADMISFYVTKSSSHIIFTLLGFVIYAVIVFISSILETTRKAYVDPHTGLTNKIRWNDLLNDNAPVNEDTGMIMMDLNGLKTINDTYGHEMGDEVLLRFAGLLRNMFPSSSMISRWGGDEFAIMTTNMDAEKLDKYMEAFRNAVDESNRRHGEPHIHFAMGRAFAVDYPGLNHRELLSVADSQMYVDKRNWYAQREKTEE